MAKEVEAKITVAGRESRLFTKSNYYWIDLQSNVSEIVEGSFNCYRKFFTANDGRRFDIRSDFSAVAKA